MKASVMMDRLVGILGLMFVVAIGVRVLVVYRQTGRLPVILNTGDAAHDFIHRVLACIIALQALNIIAFRLQVFDNGLLGLPVAHIYAMLHPFPALETPTLRITGLVLAFAGLAWSVLAQHQMGDNWRVGFDAGDDQNLVMRGLYARIRHPIYTGFIVISIGLFLAVPNALSLVLAVMTPVVLAIEARLEEAFLTAQHGDAYANYMNRTKRWV